MFHQRGGQEDFALRPTGHDIPPGLIFSWFAFSDLTLKITITRKDCQQQATVSSYQAIKGQLEGFFCPRVRYHGDDTVCDADFLSLWECLMEKKNIMKLLKN